MSTKFSKEEVLAAHKLFMEMYDRRVLLAIDVDAGNLIVRALDDRITEEQKERLGNTKAEIMIAHMMRFAEIHDSFVLVSGSFLNDCIIGSHKIFPVEIDE